MELVHKKLSEMRVSEEIIISLYVLSNDGNLLKISISEIPIKQIRINQGVGVNVKYKLGVLVISKGKVKKLLQRIVIFKSWLPS